MRYTRTVALGVGVAAAAANALYIVPSANASGGETLRFTNQLDTRQVASALEVQSGPDKPGSTVWVHGDGSHVTLSRSSVDGGRVTFKVDTSNAKDGSDILLFRLVGNANLGRFNSRLT